MPEEARDAAGVPDRDVVVLADSSIASRGDGSRSLLVARVTRPEDPRPVQHGAAFGDLVPLEHAHDVRTERELELELELPDLAAPAAPADEVVPLAQQPVGLEPDGLREPLHGMHGRRPGPEPEAVVHGSSASRVGEPRRPDPLPSTTGGRASPGAGEGT
ncbi:hypothetical protein [Clavibacter californiensis]|uniref:hypothetical protein n=1 Tax=Clavibacter californiensis TaxID=1401995 RepID=UPI0015F7AF01|nr:hypothetical protein [Clavibacter californiensis]UKF78885.1 hypothetical protein FGD68_08670 [Clavibacter californiensis]